MEKLALTRVIYGKHASQLEAQRGGALLAFGLERICKIFLYPPIRTSLPSIVGVSKFEGSILNFRSVTTRVDRVSKSIVFTALTHASLIV